MKCEVIHGQPEGLLEGSHLYKHDGKYYLTCIWWPRGSIRTQVCFRADKIDGNYADNMKVILSDDMGYRGHGVAQGCFIDTPNGEWWAMMMQDHEAVGRVPVLMPLHWKDGWPMLGDEKGKIGIEQEMPVIRRKTKDRITASDEFNKSRLDLVWQWNHNPDNSLWSLTERKGFLRLKTDKVVPNLLEARNTLTQRSFGPKSEASIRIDISYMKEGDHAGLSMFCKFEKDFIGKEALLEQKAGNLTQKLVGIEIEDNAIPRAGYPVELADEKQVGVVTTGYHSISLDKSICFALVDKDFAALDTPLNIRIRKKVFPGKVVKKRFYQTNYKK